MSEFILHCGDCLEVLPTLDECSVGSVVTDPPYGLSFMGKDWDHGVPGVQFWREVLRVAKPGAYLLAFGGTRTYHRLTCAIEDAGWEIRDCVMWVYGSGFPKSLDVGKAIDANNLHGGSNSRRIKAANDAREGDGRERGRCKNNGIMGSVVASRSPIKDTPATPEAQEWSGWGTALKPSYEPVIVARKPLIGTVAQNVLTHGTGALNIDGCRVGIEERAYKYSTTSDGGVPLNGVNGAIDGRDPGKIRSRISGNQDMQPVVVSGRWPANFIHDGSEEVVGLFPGSDNGSAARFFYNPKASKADRDEGCEGMEKVRTARGSSNNLAQWVAGDRTFEELDEKSKAFATTARNYHPTVKPTELMRYLCRLVTRPGGVVLDPFMGSGSTGKAAIREGFKFIGIEQDPEFVEIARQRIGSNNQVSMSLF